MKVKDIGEFNLIARLMKTAPSAVGVVVAAGDDAAVVEITPAHRAVLTCDCMVEDVHFLRSSRGWDIGYKLMAGNISDIAAMGARPRYAVITLVTPSDQDVGWLEDLYAGIHACARHYGCAVVGGDTSSGPKLMLSVALLGEVPPGGELLRSNARPGDVVVVSGPLGGSHAGLQVALGRVSDDEPAAARAKTRHFRPNIPLSLATKLSQFGCRCANDISDGLASEAREIAAASGVMIVLDRDKIPFADEAVEIARLLAEDPLHYALYGGEEYALLFCLSPAQLARVSALFPDIKVVGKVTEGEGVFLYDSGRQERLRAAYTHFG